MFSRTSPEELEISVTVQRFFRMRAYSHPVRDTTSERYGSSVPLEYPIVDTQLAAYLDPFGPTKTVAVTMFSLDGTRIVNRREIRSISLDKNKADIGTSPS
jgi:hypothetical protein